MRMTTNTYGNNTYNEYIILIVRNVEELFFYRLKHLPSLYGRVMVKTDTTGVDRTDRLSMSYDNFKNQTTKYVLQDRLRPF